LTDITSDVNSLNRNLRISHGNKHAELFREFVIKKKTNPNSLGKEIQNLINNPSLGPDYIKNKLFYVDKKNLINLNNKFKSDFIRKNMSSFLMATRVQKHEDWKKYENKKNDKFSQSSLSKMKLKTIKWILDNKSDVIERLMENRNILSIDIDKSLSKTEFLNLMKSNGITNDIGLINKIFWVFDENGDDLLKYKEIRLGIEMFRDSSIDIKLKAFFDFCDVDNSGTISKFEFLNLIQRKIINNNEKVTMKSVVDKVFASVILDSKGEIT
jgi:Ca2+-binding EF-hand superfamily protein